MEQKEKGILSKVFSAIGNMFSSLFSFGGNKELVSMDSTMSPSKMAFHNFIRNKVAMFGLALFIVMTLTVTIGSAMNPVDYLVNEPVLRNTAPGRNFLSVPKKLKTEGIKKITSGVSFSFGLSNEGKVYFWGVSTEGVSKIPEQVKNGKVKDIVAGDRHVLALMESGELVGWGLNSFDQAGVPLDVSQKLLSDPAKQLFANDLYSGIVTQKGNAYIWGSTLNSKLNIIPEDIQGRIVEAVPTSFNTLFLLDDNTVAMNGLKGQVFQTTMPESIQDGSLKISQIAATQSHGLALDDKGQVHVWGSRTEPEFNVPESVMNQEIVSIAAGKRHFSAVGKDGKVYSWGVDYQNQTDTKPTEKGSYTKVSASYYQNYAFNAENNVTPFGFRGFMLGADHYGRDTAVRLLHGGKTTMFVGVMSIIISTFIGVAVGLIAGFYGGRVDNLLMRFSEIVSSFPFLPLAITLSTILVDKVSQSQRLNIVMVILGVISWPGLARMIRGQILAEREKDFVLAANALGIPTRKIIMKHILPSVFNIIIVSMTLGYASILLTESGLSFLGFGVIAPEPSWGNMLSNSQSAKVIEFYWWQWMLPALCVLLASLAINLVGDGLREALDPKSNEK